MEGYIYCFSNTTLSGIYKIGYTTRSPLERLQEANTSDTWSLPDKYKFEFAKKVDNCIVSEKIVHSILEQFNTRVHRNREFFKTSLSSIKLVFDLIQGEWYVKPVEPSINDEIANNAITCNVCSKIYKNTITYTKHITLNRCHVKVLDNICQYCNSTFKTKQNKQKHELRCSANKTGVIDSKMKIISKAIAEIKNISGTDINLYSNISLENIVTHQNVDNQTITNGN